MKTSKDIRLARARRILKPWVTVFITVFGQVSTIYAGNEPVARGEDPSMGLISSKLVVEWQCGATLLSPKWALTTTDCCAPYNDEMGSLPEDDLFLTAGSTELYIRQKSDAGPVQTVGSKYHQHPQRSYQNQNTFCLLELQPSLAFYSTFFEQDLAAASIYNYPAGEMPKAGTNMTIYRWKNPERKFPYQMFLRKTPCTVLSSQECKKNFPRTDISATFCCATERRVEGIPSIESDQIMLRNETTGQLALVGQQLHMSWDNPQAVGLGLFNVASQASAWISQIIPPPTPAPTTTTTTTTPAPTTTKPIPIDATILAAARAEANASSLTSATLNKFSENLSQDLSVWYAARYFNWTRLILNNTAKELPTQLDTIRREIKEWEQISNLSGVGLFPRPSLIATVMGQRLANIFGLDLDQGTGSGITWSRTKSSTLEELKILKTLDKPSLDSAYGCRGLLNVNTTHWLSGPLTRNLIEGLRTGLSWLEFLQQTLQTLSSYPVQSRSKSELAARIGRCDLPSETTLLNCLTNIVATFPQPSYKTPAGVLQSFKALGANAQQIALQDLNGLVQVTLKDEISCTYDPGSMTLVARGRFLTLKEVVNGKDCLQANKGRVKTLLVFATLTIFVDTDINGAEIAGKQGEPLNLYGFAPIWEVATKAPAGGFGSPDPWVIDLSGSAGEDAPSTKPGSDVRGIGIDGRPGGPGQNGGNFLAMGSSLQFSGAEPALRILLNGGVGGLGQDGGDGRKGQDGRGAEFDFEFDPENIIRQYHSKFRDPEKDAPCQVSRLLEYTQDCPWNDENGKKAPICYELRCPGVGDGPGKVGGNGGKGGVGGNPGVFIDFLGLSGAQTEQQNKSGGLGPMGKGGVRGPYGKKGPLRIIHYLVDHDHLDGFILNKTKDYFEAPTILESESSSLSTPLLSACDKYSPLNPVAPSLTASNSFENRFYSSYLSFAMDQILDLYNQVTLTRFLISTEGNATFQLSREPLEPFQDLQSLEIGAARFAQKALAANMTPPDLSPLFFAFLSKVYDLAVTVALPNIQHPRRHIPAAEYRKALFALYTAGYSRLVSFSGFSADPLLVVDVAGYLANTAAAFKELQISQQNRQRLQLINDANNAYQTDINNKFREADLLIQNILNPALEKTLAQIDKSTSDLVTQIVELEKQAKKDLKALEALQAKLRARGPLEILVGIFQMVGSALAMFGKKGEVAGAVMTAAGGVLEAATLAGNPDDVPLTPIPASISASDTALAQKLKDKNEGAMRTYWSQLDYISDLLRQDNSSDVRPLEKAVSTVRARFTEFQSTIPGDIGSNSLLAFDAASNFTAMYRESQASLNAAFAAVNLKRALSARSRTDLGWTRPEAVSRAERVTQVGLDTFKKYSADQSRLDVVARQISETKQAIAQIEQQKANVENIMRPVLGQMRNDLDRARQTMAKQSAVALTVNQWQVQQMLSSLKTELRKMFTAGFSELDDSLSSSFDSLQETMTTLTNVYDKLETLQGQSKLGNLISRSQSAALANVIVKDPDLNRALNNLNAVIQSVVVSDQYEFALKSFNTWIFPFARFFCGEFQLPVPMQSLMLNASQAAAAAGATTGPPINGSLNAEAFVGQLLDTVGNRLDKLGSKMSAYQKAVMVFDEALIPKAQFYRPLCFYKWPAGKFRNQTTSLLRGLRVTFRADVRESYWLFHAVKFRKVALEFGPAANESGATPGIINSYLSHFTISLTHTGNSGYRYSTSYFNVMTPSLKLEYRYSAPEKRINPVDANGNYEKVMNGDLSLSPYTLWDMQIFPDTRSGVEAVPGFQEVMKIAVAGGLDLYLVGEGSRVTTTRFTEEDLQLDRYYSKEGNETSLN